MRPFINYITLAAFCLCQGFLSAQSSINLTQAIEIALNNNAKLRTETKLVQYRQALVNTAYRFEPTQINAELGQFNSAFFDTGFGVSQSFFLPKVYKKRAEANRYEVKSGEAYVKLTEAGLRRQLEESFLEYRFLIQKESLLRYQDSLYSGFLQKTNIRLEKGESDILEKTTAEQQKLNLSNQLAMLSKMKDYVTIHLNWLLNDGGNYVPEVTSNEPTYNIFYDSTSVDNHPAVLVTEQELLLAKSLTQVEKTALLPEIMFGYRNVSIRGTGADNQVYGSGDRFSSFQVGFGLPLFTKGIRSSIQSAKIMEDIKTHEYNAKKGELLTKIQQQYVLYNETLQQVRSYEQKALPNAKTIRSVSDTQFSNGQINYLEYVMLTQQAIQIESEYLELKRNLNLIIIDLYYLTNH